MDFGKATLVLETGPLVYLLACPSVCPLVYHVACLWVSPAACLFFPYVSYVVF